MKPDVVCSGADHGCLRVAKKDRLCLGWVEVVGSKVASVHAKVIVKKPAGLGRSAHDHCVAVLKSGLDAIWRHPIANQRADLSVAHKRLGDVVVVGVSQHRIFLEFVVGLANGGKPVGCSNRHARKRCCVLGAVANPLDDSALVVVVAGLQDKSLYRLLHLRCVQAPLIEVVVDDVFVGACLKRASRGRRAKFPTCVDCDWGT